MTSPTKQTACFHYWTSVWMTPVRKKVKRFEELGKRGGVSVGKKGGACLVVRRMKVGRTLGGQVNAQQGIKKFLTDVRKEEEDREGGVELILKSSLIRQGACSAPWRAVTSRPSPRTTAKEGGNRAAVGLAKARTRAVGSLMKWLFKICQVAGGPGRQTKGQLEERGVLGHGREGEQSEGGTGEGKGTRKT